MRSQLDWQLHDAVRPCEYRAPKPWRAVLPLNPEGWKLWTPDFDYDKEPYWVRTSEEMEPVLAYPNAGMLHEMNGGGRYFYPCDCEVIFAGWENDPYYPSGPISQQRHKEST